MMRLDLEIARANFIANRAERALHDPGPWYMEYGSITVTAHRAFTPEEVVLWAIFPEVCWVVQPVAMLTLICGDVMVGCKQIDHPGDGPWRAEWVLGVTSPALA